MAGDAEVAESRGQVGTPRAVLAYALHVFRPARRAARGKSFDKLLARGVECSPQAEVFSLM